ALSMGASAATRVRATAPFIERGRAVGARVRDLVSGSEFVIRADHVIDATGVWAARPEERFASVEGGEAFQPSRGSHIVIRRERLDARGGITLRVPGRVVFII